MSLRMAIRESWFACSFRARSLFPDRVVVRKVQGVRLEMPWTHRLPDYAALFPRYGQNLVELAVCLRATSRTLHVLDVGANLGDSALQILSQTDAQVLCVEADPYWLNFLERNVGSRADVIIQAALIIGSSQVSADVVAVRHAGTTHFIGGVDKTSFPRMTASELRAVQPDFADVRLIKSDTDGFEARIVPELARAWATSKPALFFEYDPAISAATGDADPARVWTELAELGYSEVAVWDNYGNALGRAGIDDVRSLASSDLFDLRPSDRGFFYWDVALAREDDPAALAALRQLVPASLLT